MAEEELRELRAIKKLMVLGLLNQGIQAGSLAEFLEIDAGDFSRMFPVRKLLVHKQEKKQAPTSQSPPSS